MGGEWKEKTLGAVVELKRGYDLPKKHRKAGDVPIISSAGISDTHLDAKVKGPGVVTGRYGTIGEVFYSERDFWPLNTTLYVRDFKGNDEKFIYYFLQTIAYLQYSDKAAVPGVNRNHLHMANIFFPCDITEQKAIAHILGTLDDKIELNRRMSATLEAMARALFKSWFVDFDPVIDNALAAGNPIPEPLQTRAKARKALGDQRKPLPAAIQKQFPSRFVFTEEMGWVPEGWEVEALEKILNQRNERIEPSEITRSMPYVPIDCISPKSLFLSSSNEGEEAKSSLIRFYEGDILFGAMRPYFHKVCIAPFDGTTRTTAFVLRPNKNDDFSFSVLQLHQEKTIEYATAHSTGTTIPYAKWANSLSRMPIICPSKDIRSTFTTILRDNLRKIPSKYFENQTLVELRDSLLPKLLSGQLRIPDAEQLLAEVT
jgi:type I restriction enzyme, S subunit